MRESRVGSRNPAGAAGFALILAILSLLLLTFLGLTLAVTTSTELQIATNYRWSQQALYNAEAGVEAGKALLSNMNWASIVWTARAPTPRGWDGVTAPSVIGATAPRATNDEWGNPSRNFENWECDERGNGVGFGVVLDDGSAEAPYQYKSTIFGQPLSGAFTLWVRRPTEFRPDGSLQDWDDDDDTLIVVVEGIAPYTGGNATSSLAGAYRAVQKVEVTLTRAAAAASGGCGERGGQAGGGPLGAGFDPCGNLTGGAAITGALAGAATGDGSEINPNQ